VLHKKPHNGVRIDGRVGRWPQPSTRAITRARPIAATLFHPENRPRRRRTPSLYVLFYPEGTDGNSSEWCSEGYAQPLAGACDRNEASVVSQVIGSCVLRWLRQCLEVGDQVSQVVVVDVPARHVRLQLRSVRILPAVTARRNFSASNSPCNADQRMSLASIVCIMPMVCTPPRPSVPWHEAHARCPPPIIQPLDAGPPVYVIADPRSLVAVK